MRILAVADTESKALWDYFEPERLKGIDLILSCGDLDPQYLSFLATFFRGPVLYVHGNHDTGYQRTPPEGCICIDDRLYEYQGLRILGLGGSMRYKPGPCQYTERQMGLRALKLWPQIRAHKGFDILLTHAPAYELGDMKSLPHAGFTTFRALMEHYEPSYMVHGHVHLNYDSFAPRICRHHKTTIINAFEKYIFEV